jgi:predicted nucleic acid-binding protein
MNTKAPHHQAALEIFRPNEREKLCVSSQVMAEFYSYLTNPAMFNKSPRNELTRLIVSVN